MRHVVITFLFLLTSVNGFGQERIIRKIPDIPGYQTLICDFHLHTVFSDGLVWPTVRVDEAWREGIDAIAITDHLEYLPHKNYIKTDHNRAWSIAKKYAKNKGVIVIAGTEITKGMPPGHFNAIFINDANLIINENYLEAISQAASQGAFIIWNHPGWKAQQPDTMKWWDEHTLIYEKGWLHGIEVVNNGQFYPGAIKWANEKKLTILGNSDEHGPFINTQHPSSHRPSTLVFATQKSEGGIREALFNHRTAAYDGKNIIGEKSILESLATQCLKIRYEEKNNNLMTIRNTTELEFNMVISDRIYKDYEKRIQLKPGFEYVFELKIEDKPGNLDIIIENFIIGEAEFLTLPLSAFIAFYE